MRKIESLIAATRAISLGLVTLLALASCIGGNKPERAALKQGDKPFKFDFEEVRQFSIVKSDPISGDQWTAEVRHTGPEPTDWEIVSAPGAIIDRRANGNWIRHLLDTLRTISIESEAPEGPLGSYGLENPLYGLRWSPPGLELRLGNTNADRTTYAVFPPDTKVYQVRGASVEMLRFLESFNSLRRANLATFEADDIDEIEVRKRDGKKSYVQREGDEWTDRKHKKVAKKIREKLEALSHARVKQFIDDEAQSKDLATLLGKNWNIEAEFKDRHDKAIVIRLMTQGERVYGEINSRPNSVFELYPQLPETMLSFF